MSKNKYITILLLAIIAVMGYGCKSNEESGGEEQPTIKITSSTTITVSEDESSCTIYFTSTGDWTATVSGTGNSWCTLDTKSGTAGDRSITAQISANSSYNERNTKITIRNSNTKANITVTQKQRDAILLTTDKIETGCTASTINVEVKANVSYTYDITKGSEWIKTSSSSSTKGLETSTLSFDVSDNWDEESREGEITVTNGVITEKVKVYQAAGDPRVVITQKNYNVGSSECVIKVEITSNCDYSYKMPEVDWISEDKTKGVSEYTHYFNISENTSYDNRTADIIFRNLSTDQTDTVTITQSQVNAIIIAKDTYELDYKKDTLSFVVNTNVPFSTQLPNWIEKLEISSTKALEEKELNFVVKENTTDTTREGNIVLSYEDIVQTIKVIQTGNKNYTKVYIKHNATVLQAPELLGDAGGSVIEWGDSKSNEYRYHYKHTFQDDTEKTTTINATHSITGVKFDKLTSISEINIEIIHDQE